MKTKLYLNNEKYIAGITLKDESEPECGNMALHVCKNPEDVLENRKNLAAYLNCRLDDFVCCGQIHSSNFYRTTLKDKGRGADDADTAIPDTDALYTYEPNLLLCCFTADCVPAIFYNEVTGLIGVIHSGWQGTIKEITTKVLEQLIHFEHCEPGDLNVFIGAALSQEKFEVDEDVCLKFKALGYADEFIYFNEQTGKYHIDNQMVVKRQFELQGVRADRINIDRTCTYLSQEGFSYRQDKNCGRHMSFIMKKTGRY